MKPAAARKADTLYLKNAGSVDRYSVKIKIMQRGKR